MTFLLHFSAVWLLSSSSFFFLSSVRYSCKQPGAAARTAALFYANVYDVLVFTSLRLQQQRYPMEPVYFLLSCYPFVESVQFPIIEVSTLFWRRTDRKWICSKALHSHCDAHADLIGRGLYTQSNVSALFCCQIVAREIEISVRAVFRERQHGGRLESLRGRFAHTTA